MANPSAPALLVPAPATDAAGYLDRQLGLRLDEEHHRLSNLAAPSQAAMEAALGLAGLDLPVGQRLLRTDHLLIRLWPAQLWCLGTPPQDLSLTQTDIGHGQAVLRLRGQHALHFLADHASADLRATQIRRAATLRCRIGLHNVTLWWAHTRDVSLAVDRSLAQSLVDHLRALTRRRNPLRPYIQEE
ncbi:MAG: hypothetical protein WBH04_10260 [Albidovulum sp.]